MFMAKFNMSRWDASSESGTATQTASSLGPLVPFFNLDSFQCPLTMEIMTDTQ
jgi:hypothetical protein